MQRMSLMCLIIALLAGCAAEQTSPPATTPTTNTDAHAQAHPTWLVDYDAALKVARDQHKVLLMDFTGSDWCIWCQRLDAEVFGTEAFKTWADGNVVLLKVDFPRRGAQTEAEKGQNAKLAQRFGVEGFPTIVLLDATGVPLGNLGYVQGGADAWIAQARAIIKK